MTHHQKHAKHMNLRVCHVCVQLACSADTATSRKQCAAKASGLSKHLLLLATERKRSICSFEVCQGKSRSISLWHQKAPLFRHAPVSLPVRGLLEDSYFLSIYFLFISCY